MTVALVTGAAGFVGRYLVQYLRSLGKTTYPAARVADVQPGLDDPMLEIDVEDPDSVQRVLRVTQPDEIYHLAGIAVPTGGGAVSYLRTNAEGTLHVLEAAQRCSPTARVLVVSSGLVYGECSERPAHEGDPLSPQGLYPVSKATADLLASTFARTGLHTVIARPFNHTGPGQSPNYMLSSIAQQVARIALGRQEPKLQMGNLSARRDFMDVRDVVSAYVCLAKQGMSGEAYNVCSGVAYSVEELARMALSIRGIDAEICSVPGKRRPGDLALSIGNPGKLEHLGWVAQHPLKRTITDLVAYWEDALNHEDSSGA